MWNKRGPWKAKRSHPQRNHFLFLSHLASNCRFPFSSYPFCWSPAWQLRCQPSPRRSPSPLGSSPSYLPNCSSWKVRDGYQIQVAHTLFKVEYRSSMNCKKQKICCWQFVSRGHFWTISHHMIWSISHRRSAGECSGRSSRAIVSTFQTTAAAGGEYFASLMAKGEFGSFCLLVNNSPDNISGSPHM